MATTRRRTRRPRKRFLWTGIGTGPNPVPIALQPAKTVIEILAPAQVSTIADMLVERIVLDYYMIDDTNDLPVCPVGQYITTVTTDISEAPVSEALWPPLSSDIDAFQRRPMWNRLVMAAKFVEAGHCSGTGDPNGWHGQPVDLNVKRKLGGDQSLVWVLSSTGTDTSLWFRARVLCSVGRK